MNAAAWVGAIEAAIGILYLALIGQRSIAQWLDDRRRRETRRGTEAAEPTPTQEAQAGPRPSWRLPRPRLLSVQSAQEYVEYVWRDPLEAALVTGKALTLGCVLIFGTSTLLLWIGALVVEVVAFFSGSAALDRVAGQMGFAGLNSGTLVLMGVFLAALDLGGLYSLTEERKREQAAKEEAERRQAQAKERATRRRAADE